MATYRTGLQFDNKTAMAIVWGSITFSDDDFQLTGIPSFFTSPQVDTQGDYTTVSGPMSVAPGTWIDEPIEIYRSRGYVPIKIVLKFTDGHQIAFDDLQRRAYDNVEDPLPVQVTQQEGPGVTDRMSVSYWTRHDLRQYEWGLVSYIVRDETLTNWMSSLDQTKLISAITIPGTHDSGTWTVTGNAQCQTLDVRQQLDMGIRFIDVRVQLPWLPPSPFNPPDDPQDLPIYHGSADMGLLFRKDILLPCKSFLAQNPTETVIMMVSRNFMLGEAGFEKFTHTAAAREAEFVKRMGVLLNDPVVRQNSTIPTVGNATKSIVLITRYKGGPGIILQSGQPDDGYGTVTENGITYQIQDVYGYGFPDGINDPKRREKVDKKWSFVDMFLNSALAAGNSKQIDAWWINFTSASGPPTIMNPIDFAKGVGGQSGINQRTYNYLISNPKGYYGTVLMDFPEFPEAGDLIMRLINSNN